MNSMTKKRLQLSEQIRRAIIASGITPYRICKDIGITQPSMTRFMSGKAWLSMPTLDRIAALLDLNIATGKDPQKGR